MFFILFISLFTAVMVVFFAFFPIKFSGFGIKPDPPIYYNPPEIPRHYNHSNNRTKPDTEVIYDDEEL